MLRQVLARLLSAKCLFAMRRLRQNSFSKQGSVGFETRVPFLHSEPLGVNSTYPQLVPERGARVVPSIPFCPRIGLKLGSVPTRRRSPDSPSSLPPARSPFRVKCATLLPASPPAALSSPSSSSSSSPAFRIGWVTRDSSVKICGPHVAVARLAIDFAADETWEGRLGGLGVMTSRFFGGVFVTLSLLSLKSVDCCKKTTVQTSCMETQEHELPFQKKSAR